MSKQISREYEVVRRVRTAVFPVAGLGTRFLPATKAMPKEMLTVVDKPVIQYAVDEAREAGIEHFVFVTGRNKGVIEDHFDRQFELEATLEARGKTAALEQLRRDLPKAGQSSFTRQQEPLGLGHAVWCARDIVGSEPFALLLPDMIFKSSPGVLKQMMDTYEESGGNIIAVGDPTADKLGRYLRTLTAFGTIAEFCGYLARTLGNALASKTAHQTCNTQPTPPPM